MGNHFSSKPKRKILIHGLEGAGKTTLLHILQQQGEIRSFQPTIGMNVEAVTDHKNELFSFETGGRSPLRAIHRFYYPGAHGVVQVIDSNDVDRMEYARDVFVQDLHEEDLRGCPFLLLCNKQDLPNAWPARKIQEFFYVKDTASNVNFVGCSVGTKAGIREGMAWLEEAIDKSLSEKVSYPAIEQESQKTDQFDALHVKQQTYYPGVDGPTRWSKRKRKVLIHGMGQAGNTTLLRSLHLRNIVTSIPAIGHNVETAKDSETEWMSWESGGRGMIRPLEKRIHEWADGIVHVIDSNAVHRMEHARDVFIQMLKREELRGCPFLLLCNKQDLQNAWPARKIREFFYAKHAYAEVNVVGCSVINNAGIREGMAWLKEAIDASLVEKALDPVAEKNSPAKGMEEDLSNVSDNETLQHFQPIKQGTSCPFAKAAKLWGGRYELPDDDEAEGSSDDRFHRMAQSHAAALERFVDHMRDGKEPMDGFCIELDDPRALGPGPEDLGDCVRVMLTALSDLDPYNERIMRVNYIGQRGWRFRFHGTDFFVTTFGPCYDATSSRYAYGTGRAFVLLQPEESFARHNLPEDTPLTQWDRPVTIRDQTRVAFRDAGQPYFVPDTTNYPAAEHIVKPLKDDGVAVVRWWEENAPNQDDQITTSHQSPSRHSTTITTTNGSTLPIL